MANGRITGEFLPNAGAAAVISAATPNKSKEAAA
jgi:archaellin